MTVANDVQAAERLDVPGAPDVPGLAFRRFRGEADYQTMIDVITACQPVDNIEQVFTFDDLKRDYADLFNSDAYQDMIFADVNGEAVGYGRVLWWAEGSGRRIYYNFVWLHPDWRGKSILPAMVGWQEARLREIAAAHPSDADKRYMVESDNYQPQKSAIYEALGYEADAYTAEMVRPDLEDIPDAPLPEGFEVRPVTEDQYRAIYEAQKEHFSDHVGFTPPSDENYRRFFLGEQHFDSSLWQVAWFGGEIAGMVRGFINEPQNEAYGRKRGYTENISVAKAYRRRGLARALLGRSLRQMKERGMEEAALYVHTENPHRAMHLYESMGFREVRRQTRYLKPMD